MASEQSKPLSSEATSSSGYATLCEEGEQSVALSVSAILSEESDGSGSDGASSEASDDDEAEEAENSADEQEKQDKHDEPDADKDGANASSSATAPTQKKYSVTDDEEFLTKFDRMIEDNDTAKMKQWQEDLMKENHQVVEKYKHIKAALSKIAKEERKKARDAEKAAMKAVEKAKVQSNFTINLTLANGVKVPIEVSNGTTLADVRKSAGKLMSMTKKASGKLRILFRGEDCTEHPRKTLGGLKAVDGDCFTIAVVGAGGGEKRKGSDDIMLMLDTAPKDGDIPEVVKALSIKTIDVVKWIETLGIEQLDDMMNFAEDAKKSGHVLTLTAPYMEHIDEFAKLKDCFFKHMAFYYRNFRL